MEEVWVEHDKDARLVTTVNGKLDIGDIATIFNLNPDTLFLHGRRISADANGLSKEDWQSIKAFFEKRNFPNGDSGTRPIVVTGPRPPPPTPSNLPTAPDGGIRGILQRFQSREQLGLRAFIASEVQIPECVVPLSGFKVPCLNNMPCLLVHEMPYLVADLSKEAYAIRNSMQVDYQVRPIFGVSGCGKTRSALEVLSVTFGLYLSMDSSSGIQSNDLAYAIGYVMQRTKEPHPQSDVVILQYQLEENSELARGCIQAVLLARLWVLLCIFESMEDISIDEQELVEIKMHLPCKWLQLQLGVPAFGRDILRELCVQLVKFHSDDLQTILEEVLANVRSCVDHMAGEGKRMIFPMFLDEAQRLLTLGDRRFCSYQKTMRPILTPILQVLEILDTSVSPMGTGFSLTKCLELSTSPGSVAKQVRAIDVFAKFGGWEIEDNMLAYVSKFMSLEDPSVKQEIHQWWLRLRGRYRPVVTCLEHVCSGNTLSEALERVWKGLVAPNQNETTMYGEIIYQSLYDQLVNLAKNRSAVVDGVNIMNLLETVTLQYMFAGLPFVFSKTELMCLVELGFAQVSSVSKGGLVGYISEPFALAALCDYFKSNQGSTWSRLTMDMSLLPNSAAAGFTWEKVITDDLLVVFDGTRKLQELQLWSDIKNMPSIFDKVAQVDRSSKHVISLCREETSAYSFFNYLSMPAEDRPHFFFPNIHAGPDVVFFCSGILCLFQLKLRRRLHEVGKALQTTDPTKVYTRKDGSIYDEANTQKTRDLLLKICAEQGVIRVLVAFPAAVRAKTYVRLSLPQLRGTSRTFCELAAVVSQGNVGCLLQQKTISFLNELKDSLGQFTVDFMDEDDNLEGDESDAETCMEPG